MNLKQKYQRALSQQRLMTYQYNSIKQHVELSGWSSELEYQTVKLLQQRMTDLDLEVQQLRHIYALITDDVCLN